MNVTSNLQWVGVNFPGGNPATEYAIFRESGVSPEQTVTGGNVNATVSYDDTIAGVHFFVRPTDGTNYGPAQCIVIANQPLATRGWIRSYVRKIIGDRIDNGANTLASGLKVSDDELNEYINDGIRTFSLQFPTTKDDTIQLVFMQRTYTMPVDFIRNISMVYKTIDGDFQLYLIEEPFKAGESTASSFIGYPKMGLIAPSMGGRYYVGHFDVFNNGSGQVLTLDFDPREADTLYVRYQGLHAFPTLDNVALDIDPSYIDGLLLIVQAKFWLALEGKDVALSRWDRGTSGNARRDDMPTEKMSTRMFNAWNQWVLERRTMRPRALRLVRRD